MLKDFGHEELRGGDRAGDEGPGSDSLLNDPPQWVQMVTSMPVSCSGEAYRQSSAGGPPPLETPKGVGVSRHARGSSELRVDVACGEQSEVPHFHEAPRQDVLEKAPHELDRCKSTDLVPAGAKGDFVIISADEAMIRDGDSMGVKAKIAKERRRIAKGRFRVDIPGPCRKARS